MRVGAEPRWVRSGELAEVELDGEEDSSYEGGEARGGDMLARVGVRWCSGGGWREGRREAEGGAM